MAKPAQTDFPPVKKLYADWLDLSYVNNLSYELQFYKYTNIFKDKNVITSFERKPKVI